MRNEQIGGQNGGRDSQEARKRNTQRAWHFLGIEDSSYLITACFTLGNGISHSPEAEREFTTATIYCANIDSRYDEHSERTAQWLRVMQSLKKKKILFLRMHLENQSRNIRVDMTCQEDMMPKK